MMEIGDEEDEEAYFERTEGIIGVKRNGWLNNVSFTGMVLREAKMEKIIVVTYKLRGTEKEIERIKAQIATISVCEEVVSLHMREEKQREKTIKAIKAIKAIIIKLDTEYKDEVLIKDVFDIAEEEGMNRDKVREIIEVMKRDGLLFSRGSGMIGLV